MIATKEQELFFTMKNSLDFLRTKRAFSNLSEQAKATLAANSARSRYIKWISRSTVVVNAGGVVYTNQFNLLFESDELVLKAFTKSYGFSDSQRLYETALSLGLSDRKLKKLIKEIIKQYKQGVYKDRVTSKQLGVRAEKLLYEF